MTVEDVNGRPASVLVLGGGYSGLRFAEAITEHGLPVAVTSRRQPAQPVALTPWGSASGALPLRWLTFDPDNGVLPDAEALDGITHVLVTIPPDGQGKDPVLEHLAPLLAQLPLQWIGYLSTTGVYGDHGGRWVDETTPPAPGASRSRARLACEQAWDCSGLPVQIFRLPAIYGPGRCPFQNLLQGTSRLVHKPGQVFSRVHVDDIVGALIHCIGLPPQRRPRIVNLSDDRPCPSTESLGYAAHLPDCKLPAVERFQDISGGMSPMALSFWVENRRASNHRLCHDLGYALRYPSYREGYREALAEERRMAALRNGEQAA
jgi:nucleoside-diphosphate-sugar epimerase